MTFYDEVKQLDPRELKLMKYFGCFSFIVIFITILYCIHFNINNKDLNQSEPVIFTNHINSIYHEKSTVPIKKHKFITHPRQKVQIDKKSSITVQPKKNTIKSDISDNSDDVFPLYLQQSFPTMPQF